MDEIMLKVDNVSKMYKLGQIGGTTLRDELQRFGAKLRHKEDPTQIIGAKSHTKNETFMALNGVSFEVKKGERVGIIGHNGAGKSTLLKLISRITAPTGGTISMNGRVASMLEVGTGFNGELTGRENIYMNGAILGMTKKEIDAKIEDIIEFSECRQFIDTPVKRYSSGMYVKLAFSVAAHLDSEIMIMDEVLAVGDMKFQEKCLGKMNTVSQEEGRTILYVSHNMNTIRQLCTKCIVLNHGRVVYEGDVETAISYYTKTAPLSPNIIDLSAIARPALFDNNIVSMQHLCVNSNNSTFYTGSVMELTLDIISFGDIKNIRLEIPVRTSSEITATRFFSKPIITIQKGERLSISFSLDISSLTPGRFTLSPILRTLNEYGAFTNLDGLSNVYTFEIIPTNDFNEGISWNSLYNGYLISPPITIKEIH